MNLVLDPLKDTLNYTNINNPRSRKILLDFLSDNDMVNIYRQLHPNKQEFTWKRKNPNKKARLELFLISASLSDLVHNTTIIPTIDWTDHSLVQLHIITNKFIRGKGTWKLNCELLYNEEYIKIVK